MSYGLIGLSEGFRREATDGLGRVAQLEQQRNQANQQIEAANHQSTMNSIGSGAGLGASIGMAGGPIGAGVGAVVGGVGGFLVSSIFG